MIVDVRGGRGLAERLAALGVMPGKKLTKIGAMAMRGPLTVALDRMQVAIGYGMAGKIVVEVDSHENPPDGES